MGQQTDKIKEKWKNLRSKSGFKDFTLFLIFVLVSAVFWLFLAFNDNAQDYFNVSINVVNKPDSVIFISDIPENIHVAVNDKGTNLWRHGYLKKPVLNIDFKEFAEDGVLRFGYTDLQASLKETFGGSAQISALSVDSLHLYYTSSEGKMVPVIVDCNVIPISGSVLDGDLIAMPEKVEIYGDRDRLDTIHFIRTENKIFRDISESKSFTVKLQKIKGVKAIPDQVSVHAKIEPLIRHQAMITVDAVNVPNNVQLLLFPSKVPVEYYVAMSRVSDNEDTNIQLIVDYDDITMNDDRKLKVDIGDYPSRLKNLKVLTDSVEYALVKDGNFEEI